MPATRVLVVEDERIVALNLKQRLAKLGYETCALAASGAEALTEIARSRPDVVLMDINIEGDIDGIETASRIPAELHTPVIYLTAYSEQTTLDRARATTPYGYLLKPFSERELHATIQMVLARCAADIAVRETGRRLEKLVDERTTELRAANEALGRQLIERARVEEALAQAQKMEAIGQLTGGIAHDFNNLLQGIGGALTLIRKRVAERLLDDVDNLVGQAQASAARAATLTHRLLAFARLQPLAPTAVPCGGLVAGMHDLLTRTMGEAVTVNVEIGTDVWLALCDANQLETAILNLAINARDAMPDGGALTIEAANVAVTGGALAADLDIAPGEYVRITVTDRGVGMAPAVLAHAFEPFFTTKALGQGTGLGLSMVYGFARQSQGSAKIQSEVGRGTSVSMYLPRFTGTPPAAAAPTANGKPAIAAPTAVAATERVVLVVEDDVVVRMQLTEIVRELGYQAVEAADGPSALAVLKSGRHVDLLLTDIGLPGLNGRQVADSARTVRPGLTVLFVTGYAELAAAPEGFMKPGMSMMTKPFDLDALAVRVRELVETTGSNRRLH